MLPVFVAFAGQRSTAQFVELTVDIETTEWSQRAATTRPCTIHCVVGTNSWRMQGDFMSNARVTYWFTGSNIVEHMVITKPLSDEIQKRLSGPGLPLMTSPPVGERSTRVFDSSDGNPGQPVRQADRLTLPGRIAWLAFCSGPCLKQQNRRLFPPSDLWKEVVYAPAGFSDRTVVCDDPVGLPHSVNLYNAGSQPVLQYRVTASTNVLGCELPLKFALAQYRPACLPDSRAYGTNGWELELTATGRVTAVGEGTAPGPPARGRKGA